MSFVTERDVERAFVRGADRAGARAVKLACPSTAGLPDRIAFRPDGSIRFVELKAPGKRPRPLQIRQFERLAERGHPVEIIDSLESAQAFWDDLRGGDES